MNRPETARLSPIPAEEGETERVAPLDENPELADHRDILLDLYLLPQEKIMRSLWLRTKKGELKGGFWAAASRLEKLTQKEQGVSQSDRLNPLSEEEGLAFLKKHQVYLEADGSLAGLDTEAAWELREKAWVHDKYLTGLPGAEEGGLEGMAAILSSLTGLDSERAWEMRDRLRDAISESHRSCSRHLLESLNGVDSERAWEEREKIMRSGSLVNIMATGISQSNTVYTGLAGIESPRAWEVVERLRDYQKKEKVYCDKEIIDCLIGWPSSPAAELRQTLLNERWNEKGETNRQMLHLACYLARSLATVDTAEAWELREDLYERFVREVLTNSLRGEQLLLIDHMARGLIGLDSNRAWDLRNRLFLAAGHDWAWVAPCLAGLNSDRASWARQEVAVELGERPKSDPVVHDRLIESTFGFGALSPRVLQARRRPWIQDW